jgi:hypothetical protein
MLLTSDGLGTVATSSMLPELATDLERLIDLLQKLEIGEASCKQNFNTLVINMIWWRLLNIEQIFF